MKKVFLFIIINLCILFVQAENVLVDGIYYRLYVDELRATVVNDGNIADENGAGYEVEELVIPETIVYEEVTYTVKSVGDYAFYRCKVLKNVVMSDSIIQMGSYAFAKCEALESITIPKNVVMVGSYAFDSSLKLLEINVVEDNESYMSNDGILYEAGGDKLLYAPAGRDSIVLPEGVKRIDHYAFSNCTKLETIVMPNSLEEIGHYAFSYCNALRRVVIPDGVTKIGANVFRESMALRSVVFGTAVKEIGNYIFLGSPCVDTITIFSVEPPNTEDLRVNTESCLLRVLKKSYSKYQKHTYWSKFTNISTLNIVELEVNNADWGEAIGSGIYDTDAEVVLEAKSADGYEFVDWSDGVTDNPRTIVLNKDLRLTANFQKKITSEVDIASQQVAFYTKDGVLYVEDDLEYVVYDLWGRVVYMGNDVYLRLQSGVYLIEIDGNIDNIII